jgi:hypothetical protein
LSKTKTGAVSISHVITPYVTCPCGPPVTVDLNRIV